MKLFLQPQKSQQNTKLLLSFVSLVVLTIGGSYFFFTPGRRSSPTDFENLETLFTALRTGDIAKFQKAHLDLQQGVRTGLKAPPTSPQFLAAFNVAVYFFPEALPKDSFEREVALDEWRPLQKQIEAAPHTKESREQFEEMKANIWNYENPNREEPELSDAASTVLQAYDLLTRY